MSTSARSYVSQWHEAMATDWPVSAFGAASLRKIVVSEEDAKWERVRSMFSSGRGCARAGTFTGLFINDHLWMSDTPDEQRDHMKFLWQIRENHHRVLVNGLGLGMVARALCHFESVQEIDVCDNHPDVIALVGPLVAEYGSRHGKTITVIEGDAHDPATTFPKGARWDAVWHDIWRDICADNWESMKTLRRRYGRRCEIQDVWCGREVAREVRRSREDERWFR